MEIPKIFNTIDCPIGNREKEKTIPNWISLFEGVIIGKWKAILLESTRNFC